MKKFIIKTSLYLLLILILAIPLEYLLQQIPNDYSHKREYLDKRSEEIQILILGSSHTYYGINPVYFTQKTFNGAHVSQSLDLDVAILSKYQNNLNELKVIILPISYPSLFGGNMDAGVEEWRMKNYAIYYDINTKSLTDRSELLNDRLVNNLNRLYKYFIGKEDDDIACTELGWGTSYKSKLVKDLQETGKTAAQRHTIKDLFSEAFEENIKILSSFSSWCNQRNVKLIFITTPTYYTYRENLNSEQLNKAVETITAFSEEHPGCYYFNWHDDPDFVAKDFFDGDHLNEIGAEKLSKKLALAIDSLGLLK